MTQPDTDQENAERLPRSSVSDSAPRASGDVASAENPPRPAEDTASQREPLDRGRLATGIAMTIGGALVPFLLMAQTRQFGFSIVLGVGGCLVFAAGILYLLGSFDAPRDAEAVADRVELASLWPRILELAISLGSLVLFLRLAVAGVLPAPMLSAAVLMPLAFMASVAASFRLGRALGAFETEDGLARGLLRRHGFWLILLNVLLYLPLMGSFSLSDPWETHYGEVAREILARDDWISLWWAQDGWFWSKPVLNFWLQALSFALLGVRYEPDQMIALVAEGRAPQPEWAARMPIFLLTLLGVYFLYKGVARVFGRRAGFIGGIVLTSMPYWYFLAHQSMTDMPYVAPLTAAMGLLLLAFNTDSETRLRSVPIGVGARTFYVSGYHLFAVVLILCVLPQVLYLFSRNLTLHLEGPVLGFRPHLDELFAGSGGGNCGLPGNQNCQPAEPMNRIFQPAICALLWTGVAAVFLWTKRHERRAQRLYFLAAWLFVTLSAMGKGAPGLVLPLFVFACYILVTRRFSDLERSELPALLLLVACIVLPWYVQMFMRHGQPFTDRLLFHDMYKRAFVHVHDTNVGDDTSFRYYVWQLGYGLFPWTGLSAAGLLWWLRRGEERADARSAGLALLGLWFVAAFGMFTISLTKFHHYIFPAVPPIAMLAGILVDRYCLRRALPDGRRLASYWALLAFGVVAMLAGLVKLFGGDLSGSAAVEVSSATSRLGIASLLAGAFSCLLGVWYARRHSSGEAETPAGESLHDASMLAALAIASAIAVALVGRDLVTTLSGDVDGQVRLMHLFTYNYRRPWPESVDFTATLAAFCVAAVVLSLATAVGRFRTHAFALFGVLALCWTAWGVNAYLYVLAPHWGQRETVARYYQQRAGPEEPLVAYQMNWKGENFYTGNRIPAFVQSGDKFKSWLRERRAAGVRVMFFTTEHTRLATLKSEIGQHRRFELLTTKELNNKFLLARVRF